MTDLSKWIDFTKLSSSDAKFLRAVPDLIAIEEWSGLMPWQSIETPIQKIWKQSSLVELQEMFASEMKHQYGYKIPGRYEVRSEHERTESLTAIKNKQTSYQMADVDYDINKYGFRGDFDLETKNNSIAFFGCSITFGVGVAEKDSFPVLIGKGLNMQPFNFGVPGGSFAKAVRYFRLISNFKKFEYAIFLLPEISRLEIPTEDGITNIAPNLKKDEDYIRKVYSVLPDEFLEYDVLKNILYCISIANQTNTKIYFSSWSPSTYNLLYNFLGEDSNMLIPYFENLGGKHENTSEFGRDGKHPGASSHYQFYKKAMEYINV